MSIVENILSQMKLIVSQKTVKVDTVNRILMLSLCKRLFQPNYLYMKGPSIYSYL
jgi:hypothetical protein